MYDVSAQYHKDELAKKQLLEEVISTITSTSTATGVILTDIYNNVVSIENVVNSINTWSSQIYTATYNILQYSAVIDTNTANTYAELQNIHTRQTNGTQKTQIIPTVSPTNLTLTESAVVTNGNTASDNLYVTFITSSDFTGTINGVSIPNLAVKNYPYLPGYKYPAISYTVTAGTLYIIQAK